MTKPGQLLLLPNLLGEHRHHELFLPSSVDRAMESIDGLIAESEKEGRRYLSRFKTKKPAQNIPLALFNKNSRDDEIDFFLEPIKNGEVWGLVSDCGLPCIADPGAKLVARAKTLGIQVKAFSGPSSIFLALMLSGLEGNSFTFHGYLDKDLDVAKEKIRKMQDKTTHIWMERPFQNQKMIELLMETLPVRAKLCIACELTNPDQKVITQTVDQWKKSPLPNLDKKEVLFLYSNSTP